MFRFHCLQCGAEFETDDCRRKYCSSRCRSKAHNERTKNHRLMEANFAAEWEAWKQDFMKRKRCEEHASD